ncbi:hypothetical protein QQ045_022155 [Rhodiola kirilowii]
MRDYRGDMSLRVEQSRLRLMSIQRQIAGDPDCATLRNEETHEELFNGQHSRIPVAQDDLCDGPQVKEADCFSLVKDVLYNEIAETVKNLPSFKAAGPDGYNAIFCKAAWPYIEKDLLDSIRNFTLIGVMPPGISSTYLTLIPKVNNACCPMDFRPISCCNVIYKIISTLLANRLKPELKYLVNEVQSAFVEDRNIAYNISLVQELVCNYNRKCVSKRCMLKLDIFKAYDTVDWRFLQQTLDKFDFLMRFINWIMACVSTVTFSVLINGSLESYFGSSRGLRQDDPISLYLFTLIMKVLSRLLGNMKRVGNFEFHPKCARTSQTHLIFADDVIIFSKANLGSLNLVRDVLRTFYEWSGLTVNVGKSAIYFEGSSEPEKNLMASIVNFQKERLPFTYLGVPLYGRKLKVSDYSVIIHKMTSKIKSWAAKVSFVCGEIGACEACSLRYWLLLDESGRVSFLCVKENINHL